MMKQLLGRNSLLLVVICWLGTGAVQAWGFWAHQRINRLAVFTLPPEMLILYKANLEYLTEHAVDPDKRRYAVDGEAARHYIDIDHYGEYPFDLLPRNWELAKEIFTEDTLQAFGILPYQIPWRVLQLKKAFEEKNLTLIIKYSADLGHYIGDAHVPLHTTENYNGQMTGQRGIHGFWESRLPELFAVNYDFFVGRAYLIEDLSDEAWNTVLASHILLDSVLRLESELNDVFPSDRKYGYESRNNVVVRTYSREYSDAYHTLLNGMVERRMREAIRAVGSWWYTAWKMAGSPDLRGLVGEEVTDIPLRFEQRVDIQDREAFDVGMFWFRKETQLQGLCCPVSDQQNPRAFGLHRTIACVQPVEPTWWDWVKLKWNQWF